MAFRLPETEVEQMCQIIIRLKNSTSCRIIYGLYTNIIKHMVDLISELLAHITNNN